MVDDGGEGRGKNLARLERPVRRKMGIGIVAKMVMTDLPEVEREAPADPDDKSG